MQMDSHETWHLHADCCHQLHWKQHCIAWCHWSQTALLQAFILLRASAVHSLLTPVARDIPFACKLDTNKQTCMLLSIRFTGTQASHVPIPVGSRVPQPHSRIGLAHNGATWLMSSASTPINQQQRHHAQRRTFKGDFSVGASVGTFWSKEEQLRNNHLRESSKRQGRSFEEKTKTAKPWNCSTNSQPSKTT